ncbi:MAG: GntR family transcriptional regulator [Thermodesulfobacteriota bacterium]
MRDDVCNVLRERIVNLYHKPGDPLNEKRLSEELKVSRTPIREALIRLAGEKLVTLVPHVGARVSDVNLRDFQKLIELREILERGVARLAAMNSTEEQIRDLERLSEMANHINREDISELINYDMQFHQIINQASHNHFLHESISVTQNQFFRIQRLISHKPERMLADLPKVIEALKGRDADRMEQLMVEHVEHFARAVGRSFSSGR